MSSQPPTPPGESPTVVEVESLPHQLLLVDRREQSAKLHAEANEVLFEGVSAVLADLRQPIPEGARFSVDFSRGGVRIEISAP